MVQVSEVHAIQLPNKLVQTGFHGTHCTCHGLTHWGGLQHGVARIRYAVLQMLWLTVLVLQHLCLIHHIGRGPRTAATCSHRTSAQVYQLCPACLPCGLVWVGQQDPDAQHLVSESRVCQAPWHDGPHCDSSLTMLTCVHVQL